MWHRCNLAAKESGLECACVNNDDFTVLVNGGSRHHWVSMCTVWPLHSKWLSEYSRKYTSNFALSLSIPLQKLFRWFRRLQPWATGDWQLHHNHVPAHTSHLVQSLLVKHQVTQVTWLPYSPDLVACDAWLFPKLKSPLKEKRVQIFDEIQENMMGQLMVIRTMWGPKVLILKESEASLSYVQCFLYLGSSSINASIFHITWLDKPWTDLVIRQVSVILVKRTHCCDLLHAKQ